MNKLSGKLGAAVLGAMMMAGTGTAANAEALTKGLFQARVLDYCLYDQWAKRKEKKGILAECRCASKAYVKGLEKDKLSELLEKGTLSYTDKKAVLTAHAACRK
ncbi:MAG: hypothetical protein N4A65_05695 [Cohaesibacter sp.]|jgi:hypothetical protein|nr:hypothetical protein [Cohaesibacter sp.]